ncbi:hypothetical protein K432DRAFT_426138 [Lepidopterella palustris CBS 459.81]|uniref:Calcofluor white hypersensitive protein n=1 Tax=Lepidopterella palustris CBS 459.81 TaxID=1314670 RepID=A0A8E2E9J7_9PEZI|nr:hypothetical protein K432DRAFT_426138 [Lepidopterella palustris CBS 459.81]
MAARKTAIWGGVAAVGLGTYYLYNAGGSPKVAEKQFEHDAAKITSKVRGELPGKEKEAKTQAKVYTEQAGQNIDSAIDDVKLTTSKVDAKLEGYRANAEKKLDEYRKEAGKDLSSAVDKFDKTVEQKAAQSKSWIGSWFGGK